MEPRARSGSGEEEDEGWRARWKVDQINQYGTGSRESFVRRDCAPCPQYATFLFTVRIFPDLHVFLSIDLTLIRDPAVAGQFAESKGAETQRSAA